MNTTARHVNAMGYDMSDMSRYMRYMRNISTDMQGMTSYMQDMDATMRQMANASDDEVFEHLSVLESQLQEMESNLSGGDSSMEKAVLGMKKAMAAFKGNAHSHDYSRDDGDFSMAMGFDAEEEEDDYSLEEEDDDDDDDDLEADDDDDLEEEVQTLRAHNEQLRAALRKTGAAYVMATNAYGISESTIAKYMSVVNERKVEDFDRVKDFEEYVESVRESFVGKGLGESRSDFDPFSLLAESQEFSLTEGPLFSNIKRLTGSR